MLYLNMYVNKRSSNDANDGAIKELKMFWNAALWASNSIDVCSQWCFFPRHLIWKAHARTFIRFEIGLVPLLGNLEFGILSFYTHHLMYFSPLWCVCHFAFTSNRTHFIMGAPKTIRQVHYFSGERGIHQPNRTTTPTTNSTMGMLVVMLLFHFIYGLV